MAGLTAKFASLVEKRVAAPPATDKAKQNAAEEPDRAAIAKNLGDSVEELETYAKPFADSAIAGIASAGAAAIGGLIGTAGGPAGTVAGVLVGGAVGGVAGQAALTAVNSELGQAAWESAVSAERQAVEWAVNRTPEPVVEAASAVAEAIFGDTETAHESAGAMEESKASSAEAEGRPEVAQGG